MGPPGPQKTPKSAVLSSNLVVFAIFARERRKEAPEPRKRAPREAKMDPRSGPGGLRSGPRGAKTAPRGAKSTPRAAQDAKKRSKKGHNVRFCSWGGLREAPGSHFGSILEAPGSILAPFSETFRSKLARKQTRQTRPAPNARRRPRSGRARAYSDPLCLQSAYSRCSRHAGFAAPRGPVLSFLLSFLLLSSCFASLAMLAALALNALPVP